MENVHAVPLLAFYHLEGKMSKKKFPRIRSMAKGDSGYASFYAGLSPDVLTVFILACPQVRKVQWVG